MPDDWWLHADGALEDFRAEAAAYVQRQQDLAVNPDYAATVTRILNGFRDHLEIKFLEWKAQAGHAYTERHCYPEERQEAPHESL